MSSRMRFPPVHHTSIEQTPEIRTLAQSGVSRMIVSRMNRSEVQVSEVTPPIFPTTARSNGSLKAGDRNKNQTSKLGQQRQKLDPKSGVGTEGTATETCTEVERM